ncbi:MAG: DUF885 family protein [Alphaproteobacteria bacterium]|nr:DUF885 family protein [Alphaproteobacteria bacterium]MBL6938329.1 DUF885 family protein [Alphaproteobacteria bacterium]MBL7097385.1 DUF885 family protein [Alphaproteobacteria bacterium]
MLDRRQLLGSAAALGAASFITPVFAADDEAARLNALMDVFFQEGLQQGPEQATLLGLDKGPNAGLRSRLRDESAAGVAASRALSADQLKRIQGIDPGKLSGMDRVNYDTVRYTLESRVAMNAFDYGGAGGGGGVSPYVVSQQTGAYQQVPDFLDTKHPLNDAGDADAYLARLEAFAGQIDGNIDRFRHDAGLGVIPPDFILDTSLDQMSKTRLPASQTELVQSIATRTKAKAIAGDWEAKATAIYDQKIGPALDRLIAVTKEMRSKAAHDAGVSRLPQGDAYYAAALRFSTTTRMSPDEVHQLGLDQSKAIVDRLNGLLKAQGLTTGTVGQRIASLYKDQRYIYPNTDEGKVQQIAYCNDRLAAVRPKLPSVFKRLPPYQFEVRRVPPATEAGAASAFSQGPSLDGSRPGIVYFNLHDSAEWPKWTLPTTIYHEGLPGHQLEGGLALSSNLPLIRKATGFSGYAEGWALYAEQLADEIGMYDDDPLGRIGYLKFQLFRASRCVVDTGIHHMKWSREQAIQYFVDAEGDAPGFATREVERYCVTPGQACSYKIGHTVWNRARDRANAALGAKYDIKDFHEAGLSCGRVPLDVLDGVIDGFIAKTRG